MIQWDVLGQKHLLLNMHYAHYSFLSSLRRASLFRKTEGIQTMWYPRKSQVVLLRQNIVTRCTMAVRICAVEVHISA